MRCGPLQFMSINTPVLEVVQAEEQTKLLAVVKENGLPQEASASLLSSFAPLFADARGVLEKSRSIVVTDASQKLEIKLARECRLALRAVRVEADKVRKSLKEESLRRGKAIDGCYNILLHLAEAEEIRLDEQEKFAERQEAARKAALKAAREDELRPFGIDASFYQLGEMPADAYAQLFEGTRAAHEAKIEAAKKAEAERLRIEAERIEEQARIRAENERLRLEAAAREAEAKKAAADAAKAKAAAEAELKRAKAEADEKLAAERARAMEEQRIAAAKAKAERDAIEAKAAEDRAILAKIEAAQKAEAAAREAEDKKAAMAPEKEKLLALAESFRSVPLPSLASVEGAAILAKLTESRTKFCAWIEKEANSL